MKQPTKNSYKAGLIISVLVVIVILAAGGNAVYDHFHPTYEQLTSANSISQIDKLREQDDISSDLEYDFTYRAGCGRCESVEGLVAPRLKELGHDGRKLLVVNAKSPGVKSYIEQNGLNDTPILSVRYRGYLLYQYAGTDRHELKEMLKGIDPHTHKKFQKRIPKVSYIKDSSSRNIITQPSFKTQLK